MDRQGEKTVQFMKEIRTFQGVQAEHHLGIGSAPEPMAFSLQACTQCLEVEDLSVEYDGMPAILVGKGLMPGIRCIEDAQPAMSQYGSPLRIAALVVRATVRYGLQGRADPFPGDRLPGIKLEGTGYSAHCAFDKIHLYGRMVIRPTGG